MLKRVRLGPGGPPRPGDGRRPQHRALFATGSGVVVVLVAGGIYLGGFASTSSPTRPAAVSPATHPASLISPPTSVHHRATSSPSDPPGSAPATSATAKSGLLQGLNGPPGGPRPGTIVSDPVAIPATDWPHLHEHALPGDPSSQATSVQGWHLASGGTPTTGTKAGTPQPEARSAIEAAAGLYKAQPWSKVQPLGLSTLTGGAKGSYDAALARVHAQASAAGVTYHPVGAVVVATAETPSGHWADNPGAGILVVHLFLSATHGGHPANIPLLLPSASPSHQPFRVGPHKATRYAEASIVVSYGSNLSSHAVGITGVQVTSPPAPIGNSSAAVQAKEHYLESLGTKASPVAYTVATLGSTR
ncbi:MAG: hypothetical protein ACRD0J_12515 [Acidimicrobiales bacterium]